MKAGDLKHRITIMTSTTTTNDIGEVVEDGSAVVATIWAAKWQLSSKDISRTSGQAAQAEAKFLIRYRADITTAMTIQHKGVTFAIIGTEEYEDGNGLLLLVRSMTA